MFILYRITFSVGTKIGLSLSIAFGSKTRTITRRVMCTHEPVSFWRENLIAVVILRRVQVKMSWWWKHFSCFIILRSEEGLSSFLSAVFFFSLTKFCCCNIVKPVFVTLFLIIIRKKQRIIKNRKIQLVVYFQCWVLIG